MKLSNNPVFVFSAILAGIVLFCGIVVAVAFSRIPKGDSIASNGMPKESIYLWRGNVIATQDSHDLDTWSAAAPMQVIGGGEIAHSFDRPGNQSVMDELVRSGRIVLLDSPEKVDVSEVNGQLASVKVLTGIHTGKSGYASKWFLMHRVDNARFAHVYEMPVYRP